MTLPVETAIGCTAVETAFAQCTSRCAMASGHRLNTSIVLAAAHGLFQAVSAVEPSLFRSPPPPPPLSPSRISNLASVDVKQHGQGHASSGFSAEGTLVSAFAASHCGRYINSSNHNNVYNNLIFNGSKTMPIISARIPDKKIKRATTTARKLL